MSVGKRFKQIAQLIGSLVMLAGLAGVGAVAYLWWDSRQQTEEYDTGNIAGEAAADESAEVEVEETTE